MYMANIKKLWRVYTILFLLTLAIVVFYFIKNAHFCPKGTIWTGVQCNGMGVNIKNNSKNDLLIQKFISEGCTSYYDGCNKCNINMDRSGFSCTLMGCDVIGEPKCLIYSQ